MSSEYEGIRQRVKKTGTEEDKNIRDAKLQEQSSQPSKIYRVLRIFLISLLLYIAYSYYRSPISSVAIYDMPEHVKLEGKFALNQDLQRGKQLHEDLSGPESIELDAENNVYTGLNDGRIVKIEKGPDGAIGEGRVTVIASSEKPSRPLGLRLRGDVLYVADANQGIYTINVKTKDKFMVVSVNDVSPPIKFTDDLVITKDGRFMYFTDASSRWGFANNAFSAIEGTCWGRLFVMNMKTGVIKTLIEDLCFANGVQLSEDESKLFLCETYRNRIKIIDLKTQKIEKIVVFPGSPDNIRPSRRGGYWVALPTRGNKLLSYTSKLPMVRDILAGIFGEKGLYRFADFKYGIAVELDADGDVIRTLWDVGGKITAAVSQVTETNDEKLLLGSFFLSGIAKVELK